MPALSLTKEADEIATYIKSLSASPTDLYETQRDLFDRVTRAIQSTYSFHHLGELVGMWSRDSPPAQLKACSPIFSSLFASDDPYIHRYFRDHVEDVDKFLTTAVSEIPVYTDLCQMSEADGEETDIQDAETATFLTTLIANNLSSIIMLLIHLPTLPPSFLTASKARAGLVTFLATYSRDGPTNCRANYWRVSALMEPFKMVIGGEVGVQRLRRLMYSPEEERTLTWIHCQKRGCRKDDKLLTCAKCQAVRYCTAEHQQEDWAHHKRICKRPVA
ncbi:hypothetical protein MNV49_005370 [Pseudohyphozyma bogoriensis]|nr:hypothetical protein MNV49_005370 [Pseudohyphozyma bogoriensis]